MKTWYCRICGLDYDYSPWGEDGRTPDHSSCACCGAEFGYEDYTPEAARTYRAAWLANGAPWFYPKQRPANWQPEAQLSQVALAYR